MCKIINAASVQITFDDNVIHYPTCHLYYFVVSCLISLSASVGIQTSLQVPFYLPFPHHSNSVLSTQLSACSHQDVTADTAGTASASEIRKFAAQSKKVSLYLQTTLFNYLSCLILLR